MDMTVDARLFTADELLRLPGDGSRYELVRGELRKMSPAGSKHGRVAARILIRLGTFVEQHGLGVVYAAETGFVLGRSPDTVRAPDVAFVRAERVVNADGFYPAAPDLAVEVLSPSDSFSEVQEKTHEWLQAGTRAVVLVDPAKRLVTVQRADGNRVVSAAVADVLSLPDIVPGWALPLRDLFEA